jgi:hypothetical protein
MKKKLILYLLLVSCISFKSLAQPNTGFENWHNEFSYLVPDSWQTFNGLSLTTPPNPLSAFRVTGIDVHSGNYALKLQSVYFNHFNMPDDVGDTAGGAFTGRINYSPFAFAYGFPYTSRPEKFEFWARYLPVGSDTAAALVFLSKFNGIKSDTIAIGLLNLFYQPTYMLYQSTITYYSNDIPDSAAIVFSTSKSKSSARVGSTLFLDDVALTGWVGIDEHDSYTNKVKIFPNPAKESITIQLKMDEAQSVLIRDVTGNTIGSFPINNYSTTVNTSAFSQGMYFYEITGENKKLLTRGKFNVVK